MLNVLLVILSTKRIAFSLMHLIYYSTLYREKAEAKDVKKPSNDLLDLDFGHPQISQQPPPPTRTAASGSVQIDPWGTPKQQNTIASNDPWGGTTNTMNIGAPVGEPAYNTDRLPTNSDPWSPVQQNLATAATGAIPRTSPGIGLDSATKLPDMQRNPVGKYTF